MKTKPFSAALAFSLVALLTAAAPAHAAKYKIQWLIGHPNLDYFEESAAAFKAEVEKGSNGEIEVDIVESKNAWEDSADGRPGPEIAAAVAKGEAQMGHSFTDVVGAMDPRMLAFNLPYLFRDYRHLEGVFEGPVGDEMLNGLRSKGVVGLAFTYSGGANGIATTEREIRTLEDFKGLKLGMFGDEVTRAWAADLGAKPVILHHREDGVMPLLKNRSVDSFLTTWRRFERSGLHKRFNHFSMVGSSYLVSVTYVNEKFYESLPKKYQSLIVNSSRVAARIERFKTIELNEQAKREMVAQGVRPVHMTEENRERFVEALQPVYARKLEGIVGKELIEKIRKTPAGPEHPALDFAAR